MTPEELLTTNAMLSDEVERSKEVLKIALLTVDKLKVEVAYLRRMKYGRSPAAKSSRLGLSRGSDLDGNHRAKWVTSGWKSTKRRPANLVLRCGALPPVT